MDKLLEFGRRAMFYVRVLSGYEERRIRSLRMQLQRRLEHAQQEKAVLRKLPEKEILGELRRMVGAMQHLNKTLEETETAIGEYFKPLDIHAKKIMEMQLEGEERTMKEIMKTAQREAFDLKAEVEKSNVNSIDTVKHNKDCATTTTHQA